MNPVQTLSPEVRARLAATLPEGYKLENLRFMESVAVLEPDSATTDPKILAAIAAVTAAPAMINKQGRPTVMKVKAWMVHADVVNRNGALFLKADLEAAVAGGLFKAPNLGVIDWNHSAILQWNDDPRMIGVWYDSEWAFDEKANGGQGAWGILLTGTVFSWLFPDQANEMLADQQRDGHVRFSMAAIPMDVTMTLNASTGTYIETLHQPVFFTNSALNKANADPDANGIVSEDPDVSIDQLETALTGEPIVATAGFSMPADGTIDFATTSSTITYAGLNGLTGTYYVVNPDPSSTNLAHWQYVPTWTDPTWYQAQTHIITQPGVPALEERSMITQEMLDKVTAEKAAAEARVAQLEAEAKLAEDKIAHEAGRNDTVIAESLVLMERVKDLEGQVADVTTARDAAVTELETANAAIAALETEKGEALAKLAEFEAKEAEVALAARLAARIASLPESFRTAHAKLDPTKRAEREARWASKDDAEWEQYIEDVIGYVPAKANYVARSAAEGQLPLAGEPSEDLKSKVTSLLK